MLAKLLFEAIENTTRKATGCSQEVLDVVQVYCF